MAAPSLKDMSCPRKPVWYSSATTISAYAPDLAPAQNTRSPTWRVKSENLENHRHFSLVLFPRKFQKSVKRREDIFLPRQTSTQCSNKRAAQLTLNFMTCDPTASTMPAASVPGIHGNLGFTRNLPLTVMTSTGLTHAADVLISTCTHTKVRGT